ncbi:MAG: hypothetical protein DRO23_03580 [Thermoprotei archaeon]|nr:MAG: hypothetical protein DRO23_03580 [Thermoprotei archaeon]
MDIFMYVTIIALIIYAMALIIPEFPRVWLQGICSKDCNFIAFIVSEPYYSNVVANVFSYAIFLILILVASLTLKNKRLLVVPFLLGAFKVVQSLALYYVSSKTYSIESLGLLLSELRYSINLLHTVVFSTSMAELVTLLLLTLCLIIINDRFRKRLLLAPLALIMLSMLFVASSMANIYYIAYIAALFTLAVFLLYLLRERKNVVIDVFKRKATALGIIVILLLSMLNLTLIKAAPSTLTTNYEKLLEEKPYTISLSELGDCFWGGETNRICWTDSSNPHTPLPCFNASYRICKLYLTTIKLTLPVTLLISNSSERALVIPRSDSSHRYILTSILDAKNVEAYEFVGYGDNTLYYLPYFLPTGDIHTAWYEIISYMRSKFGPLSSNYVAVGFRSRISKLFNSFMKSWSNGKGPSLFNPKPLIIFMFSKKSSITLVYSNGINGDKFLLKITY